MAVRRGPRPYSPEYGAAPFGRCWKIPAKRPSQIETLRFDLKRRSHRAIRSFRSITVLRKRSERRALRRGSLWRVFAYFLHGEKVGRRRRRGERTNRRGKRRIRRGPENCPLWRGREQDESVSPAGDPISQRGEMGERRAGGPFHKGPPDPSSRPRGLRPHWIPHLWTGDGGFPQRRGRKTRDGSLDGVTDCHSRCAHRLCNDGMGRFGA